MPKKLLLWYNVAICSGNCPMRFLGHAQFRLIAELCGVVAFHPRRHPVLHIKQILGVISHGSSHLASQPASHARCADKQNLFILRDFVDSAREIVRRYVEKKGEGESPDEEE